MPTAAPSILDEVCELTPAMQVRLLRILQDGTFERVGGQQPLRVDVRLVAAPHRDLHAMVRGGGFREDLWYRINVFPLRLPALRVRPEDIPALATHFALKAAERLVFTAQLPTPEEMTHLIDYPWPGNVRELAAVIGRALGQTLGRIEGPFGAAKRLAIHPDTLRSRMRKLGIDWRRFRPARDE